MTWPAGFRLAGRFSEGDMAKVTPADEIEKLRQEYEAGDLAALSTALYLVWREELLLPRWLADAAGGLVLEMAVSPSKRRKFAEWRLHHKRWLKVIELRKSGVKWDDVFDRAAEEIGRRLGDEEAIRKSYKIFAKRFDQPGPKKR